MNRMILTVLASFAALFTLPAVSVGAAELVYFGSSACPVCETWDEEVGEIYPKTPESKVLPLRHHDLHDETPADLAFIKGVIFTPTFVAIDNGREIGRIVGYMGDFFFWEQIDGLIKKLPAASPESVAACPDGKTPQDNSITC